MSSQLTKQGDGFHVAVIAGERSGHLLAADVVAKLGERTGESVRVTGVGGGPLEALGLQSFFDPEEIALMGVTQVVAKLPRLMSLIKRTADRIVADPPDVLLLVDSPDFSMRVAKRVKTALPDLCVAKYVAPTVWAWRPERASKMVGLIDHVFSLFPFEPDVMAELGGPPTTYVGHRLMSDQDLLEIGVQREKRSQNDDDALQLLFLPGSRRSEINALLPDMEKALVSVRQLGVKASVTIPAVERYEQKVRDAVLNWRDCDDVKVVTGRQAQIQAFREADAALAASGTVTLELALAKVPTISMYRADTLMKPFVSMLKAWSAALPNIIADRVVIPEYYEAQIRPGLIARQLIEIADRNGHKQRAMLDGYERVRERMEISRPADETVVDVLLEMVAKRTAD